MPFIPEEKIDRVIDELADTKEAVQIQTQAIEALSGILEIHGQWLAGIHAAVTKKPEGDALGDALRALIEADRQHAATLQEVLAAARKAAGAASP